MAGPPFIMLLEWLIYAETVKVLLEAKANLEVLDKKGRLSASLCGLKGNTEIVRVLLNGKLIWKP